MKKALMVAVAAVVGLLAIAGGVGATGDAGQIIKSGFICKIIGGDGNQLRATKSELWLYQHKMVLRCEGNGIPAPTLTYYYGGKGTRVCKAESGFQDGTTLTRDWVDKVGYNGNSQLTCTFPLPDASNTVASDGSDSGLVFDG